MGSRQPHRQVKLHYNHELVEIDEDLAPLIQEIWRANIKTIMCCQEVQDGIAWIEFESIRDMLKFLNLTVNFDGDHKDSLYNRVYTQNLSGTLLPDWEYQINLMDIGEHDPDRQVGGNVLFEATVGIYFPQHDISHLLKQLSEINQNSSPEIVRR